VFFRTVISNSWASTRDWTIVWRQADVGSNGIEGILDVRMARVVDGERGEAGMGSDG